jgi:hypothetical protein
VKPTITTCAKFEGKVYCIQCLPKEALDDSVYDGLGPDVETIPNARGEACSTCDDIHDGGIYPTPRETV